jgi:NSS family neurotransmitter:Na+ symporter
MLAVILATKLYALFTDGYGGYDLTLGWALIAALFIFGLLINAVNRKEKTK